MTEDRRGDDGGSTTSAGPVSGGGAPASRRLVTPIPGPRSRALLERRTGAVARGVSNALDIFIERGSGALLTDVDGNTLIDLGSGIAVASVGHAPPEVVDAVGAQAARFIHTCFMVTPYEGYVAVCELLDRLAPGDHETRSALFNSGAEAVENAVKVARYATGRDAVAVVDHAYHGRTNLAMALTAKQMPYKHGFGPFAPEVYRVPTSYPFRDPASMTGAEAAERAITQLESQVGASEIACVLIEPIQGEGGFIVPAPGFLPAISEWCAAHGILFVADEVQTGFCRTGTWFACEHEDVVPDLFTTAKGMGGGMPIAGLTGRRDVMDAVHPGGIGGTFGGNPVACAAALASIEYMAHHDLAAAARGIETAIRPRLVALAADHPAVGEIRGRGAMLALELVHPGSTRPDPELARAIALRCFRAGVVVLTCGTFGNVIRLLPPLVTPPEILEEGISVLVDAVAALA